jgi:hypothetical protein
MVPTLVGRIQTRIFLLVVIGVPWTLLVSPVLPRLPGGSVGGVYASTFFVLATVAVVGSVFWEPLYHAVMQFRWEKDWPTLFGLIEGIPEGLLAYAIFRAVGPKPDPPAAGGGTFLAHFTSLWLLVWLAANGPLRVVFLRWRFRGGRIV